MSLLPGVVLPCFVLLASIPTGLSTRRATYIGRGHALASLTYVVFPMPFLLFIMLALEMRMGHR